MEIACMSKVPVNVDSCGGARGLSRLPLSITDMRTEKQGDDVMKWGAKY